MEHLEQQLKKVLNAILVQSHINYLQSEIERLERDHEIMGPSGASGNEEQDKLNEENVRKVLFRNDYIMKEINHKKQEIINANKLLK